MFLHFTDQNVECLADCLTRIDPRVSTVGITSVTAVAAARIGVGSGELWYLEPGRASRHLLSCYTAAVRPSLSRGAVYCVVFVLFCFVL